MANRYWVGGTDTWNNSAGTKWATTSGGTGGSAVPTSADDVFFDANSGTVTVTLGVTGAGVACNNFSTLGFTGTFGFSSNKKMRVFGNFYSSSGTIDSNAIREITFSATSTGKTITNNGCLVNANCVFNGIGGGWTLQDNLLLNSSSAITLTNGALDTNNVTVSSRYLTSNNSNTRTLTLGSTTWTLLHWGPVWNIATTTGLTFNAGTSTIITTPSYVEPSSFDGGGLTYNKLTLNSASSVDVMTIIGSNTFAELKNLSTIANSIKFTAGTTQTIGSFIVSGTSGNVVTIDSDTTGTHTLVLTGGGLVSSDYLNIQHSVVTPANTWYAGANSTDNQAVSTAGSGWIFTVPPPINSNFFPFF